MTTPVFMLGSAPPELAAVQREQQLPPDGMLGLMLPLFQQGSSPPGVAAAALQSEQQQLSRGAAAGRVTAEPPDRLAAGSLPSLLSAPVLELQCPMLMGFALKQLLQRLELQQR